MPCDVGGLWAPGSPKWTDEQLLNIAHFDLFEAVDAVAATGRSRAEALQWLVSQILEHAWIFWDGPTPMPRDPVSRAVRIAVFERDGYRCKMCDDWHELVIDHVIPVAAGGPSTEDNLQTLCRPCNARKGMRLCPS